jgi:hypothetical protein
MLISNCVCVNLVVLLVLHQCSQVITAANRTLQMGVLLPYTGALTTGYGISGAVPLALEYIHTDPSFSLLRDMGYEINFTIADCSCDIGPALEDFSYIYARSNPPMDVYIGKFWYIVEYYLIYCN